MIFCAEHGEGRRLQSGSDQKLSGKRLMTFKIVMGLGWVGVMLLIGMFCRAKIGFLRRILMKVFRAFGKKTYDLKKAACRGETMKAEFFGGRRIITMGPTHVDPEALPARDGEIAALGTLARGSTMRRSARVR